MTPVAASTAARGEIGPAARTATKGAPRDGSPTAAQAPPGSSRGVPGAAVRTNGAHKKSAPGGSEEQGASTVFAGVLAALAPGPGTAGPGTVGPSTAGTAPERGAPAKSTAHQGGHLSTQAVDDTGASGKATAPSARWEGPEDGTTEATKTLSAHDGASKALPSAGVPAGRSDQGKTTTSPTSSTTPENAGTAPSSRAAGRTATREAPAAQEPGRVTGPVTGRPAAETTAPASTARAPETTAPTAETTAQAAGTTARAATGGEAETAAAETRAKAATGAEAETTALSATAPAGATHPSDAGSNPAGGPAAASPGQEGQRVEPRTSPAGDQGPGTAGDEAHQRAAGAGTSPATPGATGPRATGPSVTGSSATGSSITGPPVTGPSVTGGATAVPVTSPAQAAAPASGADRSLADPGHTADHEPLPSQLATALAPVARQADGSYQLSIRLQPEQLGTVHVDLHVDNGTLNVSLHAEGDTTRDLLRQNLPQLRAQLAGTGLSTGQFDVGDRPPPSAGWANASWANPGAAPSAKAGAAQRARPDDTAPAGPTTAASPSTGAASGLLDMRL